MGHGGDGLCGGLGACDAVDLDGVGHVDLSSADYGDHCGGIDTIDLLGLTHDHVRDDGLTDVDDGTGVLVSVDENSYATRVDSHGMAKLKDLLLETVTRFGLIKLQAHLVCGRVLDHSVPIPRILPVNAWTGSNKAGRMPSGYRPGMKGSTTLFRLYFQMPKREWGEFSTPERDREAGGHFEIGGMTWWYDSVGDYESQLICRFHPRELLSVSKQWGVRKVKVSQCRTAAHNVVKTVRTRLSNFAPNKDAAEARRLINEPPTPTVREVPQIRLDVVPPPRPRASGTDLLSALLPMPVMATVVPTGVDPYAAQVQSFVTQPAVGENLVVVKVSLPARRKA